MRPAHWDRHGAPHRFQLVSKGRIRAEVLDDFACPISLGEDIPRRGDEHSHVTNRRRGVRPVGHGWSADSRSSRHRQLPAISGAPPAPREARSTPTRSATSPTAPPPHETGRPSEGAARSLRHRIRSRARSGEPGRSRFERYRRQGSRPGLTGVPPAPRLAGTRPDLSRDSDRAAARLPRNIQQLDSIDQATIEHLPDVALVLRMPALDLRQGLCIQVEMTEDQLSFLGDERAPVLPAFPDRDEVIWRCELDIDLQAFLDLGDVRNTRSRSGTIFMSTSMVLSRQP